MNSHPLVCLPLFKLQIHLTSPWTTHLVTRGPRGGSGSQVVPLCSSAPPWPTWACKAVLPSAPREDSVLHQAPPGRNQVWGWEVRQAEIFTWVFIPCHFSGKRKHVTIRNCQRDIKRDLINKKSYLPLQSPLPVFLIPLFRFVFSWGFLFLLAELPLAFLVAWVRWWLFFPAFVCLK